MESEKNKRKVNEEDGDGDNAVLEHKRQRYDDEFYFRSYENFELHAMMISDTVRTMTYKRAILSNYRKLYKSKVADIGCGTGILSLFCTLAGALKVYAIEYSAFADVAEKMVTCNEMQDKIQVISSRAEDVSLCEKVDAIVSEWMGYGLLYENMLSSVIDFRDKYLKEDGLMFPECATIFVAALGDEDDEGSLLDENGKFWKEMSDLYKVKLDSVMTQLNAEDIVRRGHVDLVTPQNLISRECVIASLDLKTITKDEVKSVKGSFKTTCFGDSRLVGFALWFDVGFPGGLTLSTSPASKPTHWQQVVIYLKQALNVTQDTVIDGELEFCQSGEYHRYLDIHLVASVLSRDGEVLATFDQHSKLS